MRNKYTATCAICSKPVLAGTGKTNMVKNHWITEHLNDKDCDNAPDNIPGRYRHFHHFDNEDDDYYRDFTSEDVNPNEGSKG